MRFAVASAPALLSRALEAWERDLDDREAELAAKLLVSPRDAPCTRIDRDAPCTRILWLLDGPRRCPRGRRRGCRRPSTLPTRPSTRLSTLPTRPSTLPTRPSTAVAAHAAVDAAHKPRPCRREAMPQRLKARRRERSPLRPGRGTSPPPCAPSRPSTAAKTASRRGVVQAANMAASVCFAGNLRARPPRALPRRSLESDERVRPGNEPRELPAEVDFREMSAEGASAHAPTRVALLAQDAPEVPEGICSEVLSNAPSTLPTRPPTHPRPSLRRSSFRALRPGKGGASFKAVVSVRALNLLVEMHLAHEEAREATEAAAFGFCWPTTTCSFSFSGWPTTTCTSCVCVCVGAFVNVLCFVVLYATASSAVAPSRSSR